MIFSGDLPFQDYCAETLGMISISEVVSCLTVTVVWTAFFVVGGIPFGFIAGKIKGVDVRQQGSGNIGATNVFRTVGKGWGIGVFILDFAKAWVPLALTSRYYNFESLPLPGDLFLLIGGILAVLGHNYSPFLGFKGGKGMATSAGMLAGLIPFSLAVCFGVWLVTFLITRYVSLASVLASMALPVGTWIFYPGQAWLIGASFFLAALGVWRHRSNLRKLVDGTEHRFSTKRSDPTPDTSPSKNQPADKED
ncbi:MAG: glycerol-3-phosphate 1-O-acyltransferase PlsY [Candidatus Methylacidiphilales bacterium]